MKIEEEIKQSKFINEFQKAHINVLFTAAYLNQNVACILKPHNISWQQFNILRILRGMGEEPATIKILTERMIDKMSNASRLVEKLKQKGLVERRTCEHDRRRVDIVITQKGLDLLTQTSEEIDQTFHQQQMALSEEEALQLNVLLDKMRG
ncbi:MAG: MarR family transcriptional regulator [Saprospiraceae bacterium]|nr:MarR family transcriptional regulator [Saprospiraceae bacterium]